MGDVCRKGVFFTGALLVVIMCLPAILSAEGLMADLQCIPAIPPCPCGTIMGPKGCVPGMNKYMCPCFDVTNGFVTSGTCQATMKCKGESTGGMAPMLPMIPMMMPMPMMDMPQDPCLFGGMPSGSDPTSSTSPESACGSNFNSQFGSSIFDTSSYFDDTSNNATESLFNTLNTPQNTSPSSVNNATSQPMIPRPQTPTTTSGLSGVIRVGEAGATIIANIREGLTEVAGFFGGNAFNALASQSVAGRLCAARPWAGKGYIAGMLPDGFFDTLCSKAGYQVGVITPTASAGGVQAARSRQPFATTSRPLIAGEQPSADVWAEPADVRLGTRTYIFWNSKDVIDCKVTGPNFSHNTFSGGASTVPISGPTSFSIECVAPDGSKVTDSVTVNLAI